MVCIHITSLNCSVLNCTPALSLSVKTNVPEHPEPYNNNNVCLTSQVPPESTNPAQLFNKNQPKNASCPSNCLSLVNGGGIAWGKESPPQTSMPWKQMNWNQTRTTNTGGRQVWWGRFVVQPPVRSVHEQGGQAVGVVHHLGPSRPPAPPSLLAGNQRPHLPTQVSSSKNSTNKRSCLGTVSCLGREGWGQVNCPGTHWE